MGLKSKEPFTGMGPYPNQRPSGSQVTPFVYASVVAAAVLAFLLAVPDFPLVRDRVIAAVGSGLLVWLATYSLERARAYLTDEWLQKDRGRPVSRRYSLWPGDYQKDGRYWLIGGISFLVLWVLSLVAILLRAVKN